VIHADETPWRPKEKRCWLWVVLSSTTAIFHIGSRPGEEIRDLIGDAFLGWSATAMGRTAHTRSVSAAGPI
jgi:hypothetical protein